MGKRGPQRTALTEIIEGQLRQAAGIGPTAPIPPGSTLPRNTLSTLAREHGVSRAWIGLVSRRLGFSVTPASSPTSRASTAGGGSAA